MADKLHITPKSNLKGCDGYKTFTVRIKDETIEELDWIAGQTNRSRNQIINIILEYGIENCEISTEKQKFKRNV